MALSETYESYGLTPQQIISCYADDQWEKFIEEWMYGFDPPYTHVARLSGPGDMGRDVVGYLGEPSSNCEWDNYQCKHYGRPLSATRIWVELAKLCYYTHLQAYTIPRKYRFVAPREVSPALIQLFLKPNELRSQLIANWQRYCESKIISEKVPLKGALLKHVNDFDFSIVWYVPLAEVILQHRRTQYWSLRFKRTVPSRPSVEGAPDEPQTYEARYVRQLLDAYGDVKKETFSHHKDIEPHHQYREHFRRSREKFFQAEQLNRFSRDNFPPGAFESLKQEVYDGVVDTSEREYLNGFSRVLATTDRATSIALSQNELAAHAQSGDKIGICHHLANEDRLMWVKK